MNNEPDFDTMYYSKEDIAMLGGDDLKMYTGGTVQSRFIAGELMSKLGYEYMVVIDDDTLGFQTLLNDSNGNLHKPALLDYKRAKLDFEYVFELFADFLDKNQSCYALCEPQGGDFMAWGQTPDQTMEKVLSSFHCLRIRKAMNTFFMRCVRFSTFKGMNDDVNAYIDIRSGYALSIPFAILNQPQPMITSGGMSVTYSDDHGNFKKPFC